MSITAYQVEAVGHDRTGRDFGYVNIMYRYGGKQSCPRPDQCEKLDREIAQRLMDTFTGLKVKELAWFENPREKTLKNGKPRARRAKWLPEREVDLVYLYSDHYLDARNPTPAETENRLLHRHKDGCLGCEHLVHVYPRGRRKADRHGL